MYILAIETTGPHCSVSLIDEEGTIKSKSSREKLNHLKLLTPMIKELLDEASGKTSDIKGVAASEGPGSFTGIRIGVATARALGQALDIPCIPVPSLYAFAQGQMESKEDNMVICPILDARRNQIYGCACINGEEVIKADAYEILEYLKKVEEISISGKKIIFVGDGIKAYEKDILEWASTGGANIELKEVYQHSEAVAAEGLKRFKRGEVVEFGNFEPNYMRKPEAERKLEERLNKDG